MNRRIREQLLYAQGHRCAICLSGLGLHESHIDHIIPRKAGGSDAFTNLQLTHMNCNLRKGSRERMKQELMPWA